MCVCVCVYIYSETYAVPSAAGRSLGPCRSTQITLQETPHTSVYFTFIINFQLYSSSVQYKIHHAYSSIGYVLTKLQNI